MRCPVCDAWTEVKDTRKREGNVKYRRYQCANLHTFNTREVVERVINDGTKTTKPKRNWPFPEHKKLGDALM